MDTLIEERDKLRKQVSIAGLRLDALEKKLHAVEEKLQQHCPHEDVVETSSYHTGGYDYCAETHWSRTCQTCGKVVESGVEVHHGIYG